MDNDSIYAGYAARERDSFLRYKENYAEMYPPPLPRQLESDSQITRVGLIVIVIASMIASAVHTIPKFLDGVEAPPVIVWLVGAASFVMVELAIIISTYTITRRKYLYGKNVQAEKVGWHMYAALYLAVMVAIFANVYATIENALPFEIPQSAQLVVNFLIGICPPVMAYISGDILAALWVEDRKHQRRIDKEHEDAMNEWMEKCRKSWKSASRGGVWAVAIDDRQPIAALDWPVNKSPEPQELKPEYIDVNTRRCPKCGKEMTRQSWTRHPCRFEKFES